MDKKVYLFYKRIGKLNLVLKAWTDNEDYAYAFKELRENYLMFIKFADDQDIAELRNGISEKLEIIEASGFSTFSHKEKKSIKLYFSLREYEEFTLAKTNLILRKLQEYAIFPNDIFDDKIKKKLESLGYNEAIMYSEEFPYYPDTIIDIEGVFNCPVDDLNLYRILYSDKRKEGD